MLENPYYHNEDQKVDRCLLRSAILRAVIIGCLVGAGILWSVKAFALPLYQAQAEGVTVTLTDEDCKLPAVSNLPKRATWNEKGKTYEGCWGPHQMYPIVLAYFSDKTVVVMPIEMFTPVRGA